ncbi:hypothetical protein ACSXCO_00235 [Clostridium perfringens]|uniref:hypothetical protein n=1 Tax=Clostridium perfringens TaxID=1502 RepID=UPI003F433967
MKFRITNENIEGYNTELKIRRMNYDQVVVNYQNNSGIKTFKMNEGELVSEGKVDDIIKKYTDLLKIKINRGTSALFYKGIIDSIEESIEEVKSLKVLNDFTKSTSKRGIWDKEILIYLNESYPIKIEASGRNFREDSYKFNIKVLEEAEFIEMCHFNIGKLKNQIGWRERQLNVYKKIVEKIEKESNFE